MIMFYKVTQFVVNFLKCDNILDNAFEEEI
jgi:hypothetical protein